MTWSLDHGRSNFSGGRSGQILLIKHTYIQGWHFPGGGVLRGRTRTAAIRELLEETGVVADENIELFGVYFHRVMLANDYIVLYVIEKKFTPGHVSLGGEIAGIQWFSPENFPRDLCRSTQARNSTNIFPVTPFRTIGNIVIASAGGAMQFVLRTTLCTGLLRWRWQ